MPKGLRRQVCVAQVDMDQVFVPFNKVTKPFDLLWGIGLDLLSKFVKRFAL